MSLPRTFVLVTGMTGAGRGTAAKALENLGFYVLDNVPAPLLVDTVSAVGTAGFDRVAAVVDSRSGVFFAGIVEAIEDLRHQGLHARIVFLEAADDVLVRRQEAARRPHPMSREGRLMDGFSRERELLVQLRGQADLVVDTSNLNVHELARRVRSAFEITGSDGLRATVISFGFKYGIPIDADLVADMRFLPNPYWVPDLRPLSGHDREVADYVLAQPFAQEFLQRYDDLIGLLTNSYVHEDKQFLTIAIGCTGGRHRSVAMSEALGERLRERDIRTLVVHRDLGRE